jgi:hypothetical protein
MKLFSEQRVNSHFFGHLPKKNKPQRRKTNVILVFSQSVKEFWHSTAPNIINRPLFAITFGTNAPLNGTNLPIAFFYQRLRFFY